MPSARPRAAGKGLIASGWQTCGVAMRLAVDTSSRAPNRSARPGLEYLKWLAPVRPGDALVLRAEVLDKRRSERQRSLGVLRWRWTLTNQRGEDVLDLVRRASSILLERACKPRARGPLFACLPKRLMRSPDVDACGGRIQFRGR
jgi:acyl dehydratase